jgi:hypothetical protein
LVNVSDSEPIPIGTHTTRDSNLLDCDGTVTDFDGWVWVKWDNGVENAYHPYGEDLIPVEEE